MIDIDQEIDIEASPETVFDFIADPHNHVKILPSLMDISEVSDGDVGKQGAYTFKMVGTTTEGRFVDTVFDRPDERTYELEGDLSGHVRWTIAPTDEGSQVRYQSELDLPGPDLLDAITDPIAARFLRREAESTLENLKLLVEEQEQAAEPAA